MDRKTVIGAWAALAFCSFVVRPALATATFTITATGTINEGTDTPGYWGAAGGNLTGDSYSLLVQYTFANSDYQVDSNGNSYYEGTSASGQVTAITINGISHTMASTLQGQYYFDTRYGSLGAPYYDDILATSVSTAGNFEALGIQLYSTTVDFLAGSNIYSSFNSPLDAYFYADFATSGGRLFDIHSADTYSYSATYTPPPVPEPSSGFVFASALLGFCGLKRLTRVRLGQES